MNKEFCSSSWKLIKAVRNKALVQVAKCCQTMTIEGHVPNVEYK
jgi:hypothetical protein